MIQIRTEYAEHIFDLCRVHLLAYSSELGKVFQVFRVFRSYATYGMEEGIMKRGELGKIVRESELKRRADQAVEVSIVSPSEICLDGTPRNIIGALDRVADALNGTSEPFTTYEFGQALRGLSECPAGLNAIAGAINNLADAIRESRQP
jgi:hypothetical protein